MPTYDIYQTTRNVARYSVEADSPAHALVLFEAGKATLKDDETTDVYGEAVHDRSADRDVTAEANEVRDGFDVMPEVDGRGWTVTTADGDRLPGAFDTEEAAWLAALNHKPAT